MKRVDDGFDRIENMCMVAVMVVLITMAAGMSGCRSLPMAKTQESGNRFPTFGETGQAACTDDSGRPLILLFSAPSCSHCQWVGEMFDMVAREYMAQGRVAAHHYNIQTGDDLLTEAVETRIPEKHLSIGKEGNPDGYIPYFNFGCRYDRIGTGYEKQDDLAAEAEEMCRVIEALTD
jgi:thiol-disulfide isomerase/thioredoxin